MPKATIALTHALADADFARNLADELRRLGCVVTVLGPEQSPDAVNAALASSDALVLALSPAATQTRWALDAMLIATTRQSVGALRSVVLVESAPVPAASIPVTWRSLPRVGSARDAVATIESAIAVAPAMPAPPTTTRTPTRGRAFAPPGIAAPSPSPAPWRQFPPDISPLPAQTPPPLFSPAPVTPPGPPARTTRAGRFFDALFFNRADSPWLTRVAALSLFVGLVGMAVTLMLLAYPPIQHYSDNYTYNNINYYDSFSYPDYTVAGASYLIFAGISFVLGIIPLWITFHHARVQGHKRLSWWMVIGGFFAGFVGWSGLPTAIYGLGAKPTASKTIVRLASFALYTGLCGAVMAIVAAASGNRFYQCFIEYDGCDYYSNGSDQAVFFGTVAILCLLFSLIPMGMAFRQARRDGRRPTAALVMIFTMLLAPALLAGLPSLWYGVRELRGKMPPPARPPVSPPGGYVSPVAPRRPRISART